MLNDFWFLKFDFAPHDPEVERRCRKRYQQVWHFHWLFYLIVGFVCLPLAVFIGVIDFIRLNKAAHHNAQVYKAAYYGRPSEMPSEQAESRLGLWLLAILIVAGIVGFSELMEYLFLTVH
jgi:hypothetical protein